MMECEIQHQKKEVGIGETKKCYKFATAYLQGRVRIPIGGIVREPKGMSRWNYGTDSDPGQMWYWLTGSQGHAVLTER